MELDFVEGIEDIERLKSYSGDEVGGILNAIYKFSQIPYEDVCKLRRLIEANSSTSLFNPKEVGWIINNYKFWLRIIKNKLCSKIFLEFYKYNYNIAHLARNLKVTRKSVYRWVTELKRLDWVYINTEFSITTNENLLSINRDSFPNLMFLTKYFIMRYRAGKALD